MDVQLELFIKAKPAGDADTIREWLMKRSLTSAPMKDGLLVSGSRTAIERVFNVDLGGPQAPPSLPIPTELVPHVAVILLPKPRSYHR